MSRIPVLVVLFVSVSQTYLKADEESNLLTKLDCQPAEKRVFDYESNTQLWGPLDENFVVRAEVIVHCLGTDEKGKYGTNGLKYMVQIENLKPSVVKEKQNEIKKQRRSKRGVGSWFKQAWVDVKDFFVNLFSKRNKKTDKEFEFDLEKEPTASQYQCKRSKSSNRRKRSEPNNYENIIYDNMFSTPFLFIQLSDGSIPEVRFSDKDTDVSVKNFKRHIADAFATQLDPTKQRVLEQSPIGAHFSSYSYDNSGKIEDSLQPTSDGSSLKLGTFSALSQTKDIQQLSVMRDVSPDDVMEIGDGNGMAFDAKEIGVNAKQIQQISEGRLTTTAGHMSISLVNPSKNQRTKRNTNTNEEIENYLKVKTKYSLSLTKRISKRSTDDREMLDKLMEMESKLNLKGETIISESTSENSLKEKLSMTNKHINAKLATNVNSQQLINYLSDGQNPIYNSLMKALNLEVMLNEDKSVSSMTALIRSKIKEKTVNEICGRRLSLKDKRCFDLMIILMKAQSDVAQTLLMKALKVETSLENRNEILKLLTQSPNPQNSLISQLVEIERSDTNIREIDANYKGILLLAISNLGYHSKSVQMKNRIADILIQELLSMECNSDKDNNLLVDTLEAIGNLGHSSTIDFSRKFGDTCAQSDSIRIASIHSCRRLLTNSEVQKWFLKLIKEPTNSCVIKQEVVNALIEDINAIEMNMQSENRWPKTGFNEIDNILSENLILTKHNECLQENIIRYFERKSGEQSKALLRKVKKIRSKREIFDSFWTESYCKEWNGPEDKEGSEGKKDGTKESEASVVISDRMREAEEPNVTFLKRRKCSATKRFGPSQAQAIFRADIVNDISGPQLSDYKLMAQFVAGTHFLGKDIDVGKMYVYHKKNSSRGYVNIFGNTLVDAATSDCNGAKVQPYVTSHFLPLYDFSLWIVQMSLGVRLTAEMNFDLPKFNCDERVGQIQTINLMPEAKVRAGGEVGGKVLVIKGGMNVGGDFNYFSNLKFEPSPELCLTVHNGYNPMNVSINSWYQFWHPTCAEWMDRTTWSPLSVNWQINDKHRSAWIENECLINEKSSKSKPILIDP